MPYQSADEQRRIESIEAVAAAVRNAAINGATGDDILASVTAAGITIAELLPSMSLVVVRDPDAATEVTAFADDHTLLSPTTYVVDAGAGHELAEWRETADDALSATRGELHRTLASVFADPPGSEYIDGWDQ